MRLKNQSLQPVADVLNSVGWFVPPYVDVGLLDTVAQTITRAQGQFTENDLERVLAFIYTPERLASMIVNRYAETPVLDLYD
jgi:hypothetical protein